MKVTEHTIGVDISKASLDIFGSNRQEVRCFDNTATGFREFSGWFVAHAHRHALSKSQRDPMTAISKNIFQTSGRL